MVKSVGVFLNVEVCMYVKSKEICMGRCSYVGLVKVHTHRKSGVFCVILWWLE